MGYIDLVLAQAPGYHLENCFICFLNGKLIQNIKCPIEKLGTPWLNVYGITDLSWIILKSRKKKKIIF